ncbi:MAG: hypothetical protein IJ328_00005, partial [Muribaculaceae bacterium]|nr:hypothetical protein [Muribaculaceae bacterium]
ITSIEDLTITFSGTIPDELLPQEGNVLVSDVYEGLLIDGFAGRVKTITDTGASVVIECEQVSITDIYERLIITGSSSSVAETEQSQSISPKVVDSGSKSFKLNEFSHSFENLTIKDKPVARIDYTVFIEPNESPIVSMYLYHTHNLSATIEHSQDGDHTPDPLWLVKAPIPLPYKLYVRMDLGLFWQAVGSMEMSLEVPYTIGFVNGFSYNENGLTQVNRIIKSEQGTPTANVDINGSITAGLAGRFSFGFVTDKVLSVNGEVRGGVQVAGSYKLSDYDVTTLGQDGTVYEMLKDTKIELNRYVSVNMGFGIVGFTGNVECKGLNLPYEKIETLDEWYLLPTFSTPDIRLSDDKTSVLVKTSPSRDLLVPVKIGVGLKNQTDYELVGIQKSDVDYRIQSEYPLQNVGGVFTDLVVSRYVAYPIVEIFGKIIHATPETEFDVEVSVSTGDVSEVTSSSAVVSGYGDCLETAENIAYKGIVYSAGGIPSLDAGTFVSSGQNTSGEFSVKLTDLEAKTTYNYRACVIIDGKEYYGEVSSFTTEEEVITPGYEIDLGLSVKWASWNVGASSPEEYGGYYAWGETEEKSNYYATTYKYWQEDTTDFVEGWNYDEFINIGSDISGTQYDVATVKWGNGWRMPTKEEIQELADNCQWEEYVYNYVEGYKVTGPNGNTIFLPNVGYREGNYFYEYGDYGYYWSSTLGIGDDKYKGYDAWVLPLGNSPFNPESACKIRYIGCSVRPVRD